VESADEQRLDREHVDRHSTLASTPIGRAVVVLVVLVGTVWLVGPNIPSGPLQNDIKGLWRPATELGLAQDWGVFSPNPRSQSLDVEARILYDDGTVETWGVPEFDPVIGAYRQYRWHKWQERVRLDDRASYWQPTAEWLAARYERDGVLPMRITLVRRWIDHEPLGTPEPRDSDWNEFEFYVWERDA
jgi:hypothetical protein